MSATISSSVDISLPITGHLSLKLTTSSGSSDTSEEFRGTAISKPCIKKNNFYANSQQNEIKRDVKKKVSFHPNLISNFIEPVWADEDEMSEYYARLIISLPAIPKEEMDYRRSLIQVIKMTRKKQNMAYYQYFSKFKSGFKHVNTKEEEHFGDELESCVDLLKSTIQNHLRNCGQLFLEVHPFEDSLVYYFNSIIGRTLRDQEPPAVTRKMGSTLDRYQHIPQTHIPAEFERYLWLYRMAVYEHECVVQMDTLGLRERKDCVSIISGPYLKNPLSFFMNISENQSRNHLY